MRNPSIPTLEPIDSGFTGVDGIRYYAMAYYPRGKRDQSYWFINLYHVGGAQGEHFASAEAYLQRKAQLTQWSLIE
jgi:hypothetical protein